MILTLVVIAAVVAAVYAVKKGVTVSQIEAEISKVGATASADAKALVATIKTKL
jgi:hypothetical protein